MCAAKSKQPTTPVDLDKLFKETKAAIRPKLEYLNSIDDYCTSDAIDAISDLVILVSELGEGESFERICERVVNYMRERDIAKLIVKILKSVAKNPEKSACESRVMTGVLIQHLLKTIHPIELRKDIRSDLVKKGIIRPILDDLDSCDPNTKDPRQEVRILLDIYRLRNLSNPLLDTPSIIPAFRAARAVDILMKFVKVDNEFMKINSLMALATIVNEKEGDRLATSGGCIEAIVDMLVKAADTEDHRYVYKVTVDEDEEEKFSIRVWLLAEGLNNLSSNDENKKAIILHGGLPALSMILKPDNTITLEKQNAVEALWKMSFLDECKADIVTHLTFTDSIAYEGRSFH